MCRNFIGNLEVFVVFVVLLIFVARNRSELGDVLENELCKNKESVW